jgi:alkanesulfonate monooxygenase SsuD/methylene tetrahydromethanopterin reductase-like flavin-dependent oxidoreductase (luciferase family)
VRFGINVPNYGGYADVRRLAELAGLAEATGWDGFFIWDHIHWTQRPMIDPWVALTAVALSTSRVRIGTMVTPLPRRRPWKLARETVTLDHLSGGRLTLGVGLGFPPDEEYERLGEDPDARRRARRLDEGLDVLTGLWSGEPFSYDGEEFKIHNAHFLPKPLQQPRIPVWIAGMWPNRAPFRRAARWDGAFPLGEAGLLSVHEFAEAVDYTRQHRDSDAPFDIATGAIIPDDRAQARDTVAAFEAAGATWLIQSDPEDIDWLTKYVAKGPPV